MEKKVFERPVIKKIQIGMPNKFGLRSEYLPIKEIDGIKIKDLVDNYGSPLYVFSERTIRETFQQAYKAFSIRYPKVQFAWSYKTNYLDSICKIFHQEGSWAEVVSRFEYEKALSLDVPGDQIIFNGPYKTENDLITAVNNGSYIHIDHFDEYYTILSLSEKFTRRPQVAVRVNMDTSIYPQWSRFGFNYENGEAWEIIQRIIIQDKMDLVGLHCHIGTYIMVPWAYANAVRKLIDLFIGIKKKFNKYLDYIDIGGGFASKNTLKGAYLPGTDTCPTFDQYADAITSVIINSDISHEHLPTLILETGRALIDDSGYLIGTVHATKRMPDGKTALITDIGVNLLFTSFWYDYKITPAQDFGLYSEETIVYGPLCMNIDVLREYIQLPPMKKGDNFVISRIGAYNNTQWLQFITYRPNVILIDTNNKAHIIRKSENLQTFKQQEIIPEHLK
jgi:diaminopimelate decarboxylase